MKRMTMVVIVLALVTGLGGNASAALVAHWKLDETGGTIAYDSAGSKNGILHGNPVWCPTYGVIDGALELDGDGDYVTIPKIADSVEFTYALWVNQNVIGSDLRGLMTHENWEYGSVHFDLRDGHPKVGINEVIQPAGDLDASDYTLPIGEWHHVALTKSSGLLAIYVDGQLAAQRGLTVSDTVTLGEGFIGAWVNPGSGETRYFNGLIDEVRIYNHALSEQEVIQLYQWQPPEDVNGFTYQARLIDDGLSADGLYDLEFRLFDDARRGTQQGPTRKIEDQDVIEGYFTVKLDFGDEVFDGNDRWLEISVRPGEETGQYTILNPRQLITVAPYAAYARRAGSVSSGSGGGGGYSDWTISGSNIYRLSGNVGIGTSSPTHKLHVSGGADTAIQGESDYLGVEGYSVSGIGVFGNTGSGTAVSSYSNDGIGVRGYSYSGYGIRGESTAGYAGWFGGPKNYFSGDVGIGTNAPTAKLDVDGQVRIRGGSPGSGKVLTSDSTGLASWQTPTGGGGGVTAPLSLSGSSSDAIIKGINSGTGPGVRGEGPSFGVLGKSTNGRGVWGESEGQAVFGENIASTDMGVLGGPSYGVYGNSTNGNGVQGVSKNGFAGYFDGPKSYFSGSVGIGTLPGGASVGTQLCVDGTIKVGSDSGIGISSNPNGIVIRAYSTSGWYTILHQSDNGSTLCSPINFVTEYRLGIGYTTLPTTGQQLMVRGAANLNDGKTGAALYVDGDEAIGYDGTQFSWGNDGTTNYFQDPIGIGTKTPKGALDVNGSIYQRGSVLHADFVFEPEYQLESIDEHSEFMWKNKHLAAIPKIQRDEDGREIIEVGSDRRGIVEELEKAHIYIEQLHKRIMTLEERLAKLESRASVKEVQP